MTETVQPWIGGPQAAVPRPEDADPFRYGWRYTRHSDGVLGEPMIPLTLEDVLHPEEYDRHMERFGHAEDCSYLFEVIRERLRSVPGAAVLPDMRMLLDPDSPVAHGPDIAVIHGFPGPIAREMSTYRVGRDGPLPQLLIEVVSPHTRITDVVDKVREYFDRGVPTYVVVDAERAGGWFDLSIMAFRRGSRGYAVQPLDAKGRFWMEAADLWIGTRPGPHGSQRGSVALWLQDAEDPIPGYSGLADENRRAQARAADAERAKADAERDRDDAVRRLREMEAELKRLRGEV